MPHPPVPSFSLVFPAGGNLGRRGRGRKVKGDGSSIAAPQQMSREKGRVKVMIRQQKKFSFAVVKAPEKAAPQEGSSPPSPAAVVDFFKPEVLFSFLSVSLFHTW
ncbi:hypothetical protein AKJ64_00190 [candidate division MSBL1 archaeon SCGC-AAA259E17]|uniref:Uncharacterized protein n=1 Tax=candidate division MSBL1 archaeon SCGC-AAA259E17 TaxID=1698263 RepID=A0A133UHN3_9EURY|nr:hypothetical protein AKJ64_00190 [candidate division MSBL1 archaeon SCGC-AAA259E17]